MKGQMKSALMEMTLKDTDYERKSDFERDFKFNRKLKDPRFGEVSLIQNPKTRQFLAVKEKRINDKKEAGKAIINARKRLGNKHPNILNLIDYSVTKQSELCSSFYVLKLFYEFPKSDLHREVQERQKRGEVFNDVELTHILYQQIAANNYLQSKDQHHGDIQPLNIAYDKVNNVSQLIDMSEDATTSNMSKQLQKNRVVGGQPLFQSPATYSNLKKGNLNYTVDPNKEDVYALGLTLLEVGNGQSIQNIYNATNKEVDQAALQKHVEEFRRKMGNDNTLLTSTVETMVHPDEAQRPNFRELETKLPPYATVQTFLKDKTGNRLQGGAFENNLLSANTNTNTQFQGGSQGNNQFQGGSQQNNQFQGDMFGNNNFQGGAYNSGFQGQSNRNVNSIQGGNDDWNFGANDNAQFNYVQGPHQYQPRTEDIPLVNLPITNFGVHDRSEINQFNNMGFGSQTNHKVQGGADDFPMFHQPSDRKVVLVENNNNDFGANNRSNQNNDFGNNSYSQSYSNNYTQSPNNYNSNTNYGGEYKTNQVKNEHNYEYSNTTQPSYNQSAIKVNNLTHEPIIRRSYVTVDQSYSTPHVNTSYTVDPNVSHSYSVNSQPRVEYVTMEPEYRREYVSAHPERRVETVSHTSLPNVVHTTQAHPVSYIRKSHATVVGDSYIAPTTYTTAPTETVIRKSIRSVNHIEPVTYTTPTYTTNYVAPTETVIRKSIRSVNHVEPVTYTTPTYTTGYVAPTETVTRRSVRSVHHVEPVTYTTGYVAPTETVTRRSIRNISHVEPVTYTTPTTQTYVSHVGPHVTYGNSTTEHLNLAPTSTVVRRSIRKSYGNFNESVIAPTQTVHYSHPTTQTYTTHIPHSTEYQTVGYSTPQEQTYVSERIGDGYVSSETSGLKLVKTYQDNSYSTRLA